MNQSRVLEICSNFDEQLQKLQAKKILVDQAIYEEEMKIITLSEALLREEESLQKEQQLIDEQLKVDLPCSVLTFQAETGESEVNHEIDRMQENPGNYTRGIRSVVGRRSET